MIGRGDLLPYYHKVFVLMQETINKLDLTINRLLLSLRKTNKRIVWEIIEWRVIYIGWSSKASLIRYFKLIT